MKLNTNHLILSIMENFIMIIMALLLPCMMHAQTTEPNDSIEPDEITVFAQIMGINKNVLGIGNKLTVEIY